MKRRVAIPSLVVAACWAQNSFAQNSRKLTLAEAEAIAVRNHPQIAAAVDEERAAAARITEAKSAYYPKIEAEITGSQGFDQSRIGAGALAASVLFNRFGQGLEVNQLVTDLGRTRNLVATSKFQQQAAAEAAQATRFGVILNVDEAYFGLLEARAFLNVAQDTVKARQTVVDQVGALAKAQLKSQVDVSFAQVNLQQARLLLIQAQNAIDRAAADLARALGEDRAGSYELAEAETPPTLPPSADTMIAASLQSRPELRESRLQVAAAQRFEAAERDLKKPNVTVIGVGGALPYLDQNPRVAPHEYEGAAVNIEVPIFNGHLFSAREEAAHYQELAADQRRRDLEQQIEHDVRSAWLNANTAYQRIPVSEELLRQATQALDLAQGRYQLGLASIVEVTQAQLNVTQAQIETVNARYEYQTAFATLQYTAGQLH